MGYEPQALPDITNKTNLLAIEKQLDELIKEILATSWYCIQLFSRVLHINVSEHSSNTI